MALSYHNLQEIVASINRRDKTKYTLMHEVDLTNKEVTTVKVFIMDKGDIVATGVASSAGGVFSVEKLKEKAALQIIINNLKIKKCKTSSTK